MSFNFGMVVSILVPILDVVEDVFFLFLRFVGPLLVSEVTVVGRVDALLLVVASLKLGLRNEFDKIAKCVNVAPVETPKLQENFSSRVLSQMVLSSHPSRLLDQKN